jgi:hypothetical protein
MKSRLDWFNIYFVGILAVVIICGCHTAEGKRKKLLSTFHLHEEVNRDPGGRSQVVPIYRARPFKLTVSTTPFLSENMVKSAKVVDVLGGFALEVDFDRRGTWLFEQYTAASRGKHIAVFSQFANPGEDKINEGRWLAAPKIEAPITNGVFMFTPDASREECESIARGLNNVAKKLETGKDPRFD